MIPADMFNDLLNTYGSCTVLELVSLDTNSA